MLVPINVLDETIEAMSERDRGADHPFSTEVELLRTIPGVDRRSAEVIIAESGADMSRFPSAGHLASWTGLYPGNNESAGKCTSERTRKGSKWLRATLIECAKAAARSRGTDLSAHDHRLRGTRGPGKANIAVAHSIVACAHHMLERRAPYTDLGDDYYRPPPGRARRPLPQTPRPPTRTHGPKVTLEPLPAAA
jgi:transposase